MVPTHNYAHSGVTILGVPEGYDINRLVLSESHGTIAVAWNGHEFELITGARVSRSTDGSKVWISLSSSTESKEELMLVYYPIDQRMTISDVEGATIAYANETNDGWLFAHCDADFHNDFEYRLLASAAAVFGPWHRQARHGIQIGHGLILGNNNAENRGALQGAQDYAVWLDHFHKTVAEALIAEARGRHLGYYHQNPHEAHIHLPLERAIVATKAKWEADAVLNTQFLAIRAAINPLLVQVRARHAYETRWDREARLAAEAKTKADAETNSQGG